MDGVDVLCFFFFGTTPIYKLSRPGLEKRLVWVQQETPQKTEVDRNQNDRNRREKVEQGLHRATRFRTKNTHTPVDHLSHVRRQKHVGIHTHTPTTGGKYLVATLKTAL